MFAAFLLEAVLGLLEGSAEAAYARWKNNRRACRRRRTLHRIRRTRRLRRRTM